MKSGITISAIGHAAVLLWGLVSFGPTPFESKPTDSLPIDIISASDFSQMTAGQRNAPKAPVPKPKPMVEKVADPKPVDDTSAKVVDKPEIVTASAPKEPPPVPEPKPRDPPKKASEPKVDPIAEALKKDEAKKPDPKPDPPKDEAKKPDPKPDPKKEPPKEAAKVPTPPKKPQPPQPKFDADRIAALLDKREPQRRAATGAEISRTASLGTPTGAAQTLSQSEIDALRAQIQQCWNPPAGAADPKELVVIVKILLKQDGTLQAEPAVLNRGGNAYFHVAAESALRAVRRCQPYRLPAAKYDVWKDVEVTFDPRDMFRG